MVLKIFDFNWPITSESLNVGYSSDFSPYISVTFKDFTNLFRRKLFGFPNCKYFVINNCFVAFMVLKIFDINYPMRPEILNVERCSVFSPYFRYF